ncbi:MAG: SOS response-associated peptidase [Tateyamaria sp.]|nr:SOS response-associated peptidase [Tateyamaria sp.]
MCGRFVINMPSDLMAQLFDAVPSNDLPTVPNFNVCPTTHVHVVSAGDSGRKLGAMRWGFIPHWYKSPTDGPLLINARAETIAEKPAFRAACRERRCIIPISGFYEWTRDGNVKLPWYIKRMDGQPMAMAAIWQEWGDDRNPTCAVVTTGANAPMVEIHHRIPVILEKENWAKWLGEDGKGAALLMKATADDTLSFQRVDPKVNSNRASGPQLIDPVAA